ncbi:MAG: hypothetical protein Q8917_17245 [Bacillota bacterium]|nr:hypothetical protein [Bacillota bacterium]
MKEKETKKEWKDPEITVLSVNEDTKGGSGTNWDMYDNTLS